MELVREWQKRPRAITTQHPMLDLITPPPIFTITQQQKMIQASQHPDLAANNTTAITNHING